MPNQKTDPHINQFHELNTARKLVKWLIENAFEFVDSKSGDSSVDGVSFTIPKEFIPLINDIRPRNLL